MILNQRLDREKTESLSVPIMARDAMGQVAFTRVDLIVLDVNDNVSYCSTDFPATKRF